VATESNEMVTISGSHCSFPVFSSHREDAKRGGSADDTPRFRELSGPPDRGQARSIKQATHQTGLLLCRKTVLLNTPDASRTGTDRLHQHKLDRTSILEAHRNVALPIRLLLVLHVGHLVP
jgi:hypothetical protein